MGMGIVEIGGVPLGTISQVVTMLFSGGIFGTVTTFFVRNRRITVDARKIALDAEAILREHFGDELDRLTQRAAESDRRHEECEQAKRDLRRELDAMHDEVRGLKDQLRMYSADRLIELEANCPSAAVSASARRVKRHAKSGNGD